MFNNEWTIEVKITNRYNKQEYFVVREYLDNVEAPYLRKYLITITGIMSQKLANYLSQVLYTLDKEIKNVK